MANSQVSQAGVLVAGSSSPAARISEAGILVLAQLGTPAQVSQAGVLVLSRKPQRRISAVIQVR